jgi:hypothetical protein
MVDPEGVMLVWALCARRKNDYKRDYRRIWGKFGKGAGSFLFGETWMKASVK